MQELAAIIIDDERKAALNLEAMLKKYCPYVNVKSIAYDASSAFERINTDKPDLVFLDVEMPGESGLEMLKRFDIISFELIFVTAYDKYALQAIKASAVDFLLKPLDADELKSAVTKATNRMKPKGESVHLQSKGDHHKLIISVREGVFFIEPADIVFINADGSYSTLYLVDGCKHVVSKNIKEFELLLNNYNFLRTHISYLVNLNFVSRFYHNNDGNFIDLKSGHVVEVSRRKKEEFLLAMKAM